MFAALKRQTCRLGTALLFQVKVIQGVAEFEELRSMSVQLQATEGEPKRKDLRIARVFFVLALLIRFLRAFLDRQSGAFEWAKRSR